MTAFGFLLAALALFTAFNASAAAPAIDAAGASKGGFSSTNTGSFSVTTTSGNAVVELFASANTCCSGVNPSISTVSGGGLTWILRSQKQAIWNNPCCGSSVEEWWAFSSSPLAAASITVTYTGSIDEAAFIAFGVTGVVSSISPYDSNVALPALATNNTGVPNVPSGSLTTTQTDDLLVAAFGDVTGIPDQLCSGWQQYVKLQNAGIVNNGITVIAKGFASPQTSLSATTFNSGCTANFATTNSWSSIADALTADAAATGAGLGQASPW